MLDARAGRPGRVRGGTCVTSVVAPALAWRLVPTKGRGGRSPGPAVPPSLAAARAPGPALLRSVGGRFYAPRRPRPFFRRLGGDLRPAHAPGLAPSPGRSRLRAGPTGPVDAVPSTAQSSARPVGTRLRPTFRRGTLNPRPIRTVSSRQPRYGPGRAGHARVRSTRGGGVQRMASRSAASPRCRGGRASSTGPAKRAATSRTAADGSQAQSVRYGEGRAATAKKATEGTGEQGRRENGCAGKATARDAGRRRRPRPRGRHRKPAADRTAAKKAAPAAGADRSKAAATKAAATKTERRRRRHRPRLRRQGLPRSRHRRGRQALPARRRGDGASEAPDSSPRSAARRREDESPWTKAELTAVRASWRPSSSGSTEQIADAEEGIADLLRDSGDGAGDDQADAGTKTFEREHEMSLANNAASMLAPDRARARADRGRHLRGLRELRQPDRQAAPAGVPACDPVRVMQAERGAPLTGAAPDARRPSSVGPDQARTTPAPRAPRLGRRARCRLLGWCCGRPRRVRHRPGHARLVGRTLDRRAGPAHRGLPDVHAHCATPGRRSASAPAPPCSSPPSPSRSSSSSCASRGGCAACGGRSPSARCSAGRSATSPTGCSASPGPFRGHVVDWIQLPHFAGVQPRRHRRSCGSAILMVVLSLLGVEFGGERRASSARGRRRSRRRRRDPAPDSDPVDEPWDCAACRSPTGSRASGSTPRSPGCSACRAPRPPSWPTAGR